MHKLQLVYLVVHSNVVAVSIMQYILKIKVTKAINNTTSISLANVMSSIKLVSRSSSDTTCFGAAKYNASSLNNKCVSSFRFVINCILYGIQKTIESVEATHKIFNCRLNAGN